MTAGGEDGGGDGGRAPHGGSGEAAQPLAERHVVTAFLQRADGRVLLVRRSGKVGTYRGRWSAISGYLEDPTAEDQARREIHEETGLGPEALTLTAAGGPLRVAAPEYGTVFVVHPFLFALAEGARIALDWENREGDWVTPEAITERDTVPRLDDAYRACAGARDRMETE